MTSLRVVQPGERPFVLPLELRPLDAYPPIPYRGEDGFRAVVRREGCACGEAVVQLSGELVEDAVARHNATPSHLRYRSLRAQDATTAPAGVDLSARPAARPVVRPEETR